LACGLLDRAPAPAPTYLATYGFLGTGIELITEKQKSLRRA
jgi:hypothetical protein